MGDNEYGYDYWQEANQYASYRARPEGSWLKSLGLLAVTAGAVGLGVWYVTKRRKDDSQNISNGEGATRRQAKPQEPIAIIKMTSREKQPAHRGYLEDDVDSVLGMAVSHGMVGLDNLVSSSPEIFLAAISTTRCGA
jgi:hypothetical protein